MTSRTLMLMMVATSWSLTGCVSHETRVTAAPEIAPAPDVTVEGSTTIGRATHPTPPGPPALSIDRSPLPRAVAISAWRSYDHGPLNRQEALLCTALPWWQRFPCDIATDLLPIDFTVTASAAIAVSPPVLITNEDLDRAAAAAGYAVIASPAAPPPQVPAQP